MTTQHGSNLKRSLRHVLTTLAAEPEQQLEYLARLGDSRCVDELALEFDDEFRMARSVASYGAVDPELLCALADLDQALERMSGQVNASLWTPQAIADSHEWATIRALAAVALARLTAGETLTD